MTTAVAVGYLAHLAAGVAAEEAADQFKKLLANTRKRRRIAQATAKAAMGEGIRVKPALLRSWLSLSVVQDQLLLGTHQSVHDAVKRLAWAIGDQDLDRSIRLVELACRQFLLTLNPQEATAVSAAQTQALVIAEGAAIRADVTTTMAALTEKLSTSEVFTEDLHRLHVWRAGEARIVAETWPTVRDVVHLIARSRDRKALLAEWAAEPPRILDGAPGPALCWLGQVASDYGCRRPAVDFMTRGIERGVSEPGYWWAKAALAAPKDGDRAEDAIRDLLRRATSPHPLGQAQLKMLDDEWADAGAALSGWDPETDSDRAIRALLTAECERAQGGLEAAIGLLEQACSRAPEASGPSLNLAELLLMRGYRGQTISRMGDFTKAQTLAIKARDSRRQWGGDSAIASLTAIKASALAGDLDRTWKLTQLEPDGEATPAEAADPRLRKEAATLAAMTGRSETANEIASELNDPYTTAFVAGFNALNEDRTTDAESHWMRAWERAPDDFARFQVARLLAPLGMRMPDIDVLSDLQPEMVAEMRAIHRAMSGSADQRIVRLRAHAHEYEQLAVLLAQELSARGEHHDAADVLDEAARRWHLPLLMKMAADRYFFAGEYENAVESVNKATVAAGEGWPGEFECLAIKFNSLQALGRDEDALFVARRMTTIAPDNDSARWALVDSLGRQGNLEAAFAALHHNGRPIRPRNRDDARNWIILLTTCDPSPHYLPRALDEFDRWRDDEEIAGVFLTNIIVGLARRDVELDDDHLDRLRASTDEYVGRFPESSVFRVVKTSEVDPLGELTAIMREDHADPALQELYVKIATAQLPLGMAAELQHVSYAEASLKRASGLVYSHVPGASAADLGQLLAAIGRAPVVLDSTAAISLLCVAPELRDQLMGRFSRLESTAALYRDARAAEQSLSLRSTMSLIWDRERDRPVLREITASDADDLAERASALVEVLTSTRRREWRLQHFTEVQMEGAWLNGLDYAVETATSYWCDDLVLRSLAREAGCTSFGTIDLIQALESAGDLSADLALRGKAALLSGFHALLPFDRSLFELAAEQDQWRPGGVAAALSLPETWSQAPVDVMRFAFLAAKNHALTSQDQLRAWVAAAAHGLAKLGGDTNGATRNLSLLLGSAVAQSWMTPELLPVVVEGVRQACPSDEGAADPLHNMLVDFHSLAVDQFNESVAAYVVLHWAQHLSKSDQYDATMIAISSH